MGFADIVNSPYLTQEDKIRAINELGEAERFAIDEENRHSMNRIKRGSALQVASGLPILNVPYIGTGLGGAMYEAGNAIMQGKSQNEVLKDTARGFAIGESVGAVPYIGKLAGKTKTGQAIGEKASNLFNNLKNTDIGQKIGKKASNIYDYLMTDIKALNPNKQIAYHGSPYDFNKFNNEAIGTGEKAQAHGRGHYSALNKNIADKNYRERLTQDRKVIKYKNIPYKKDENYKQNDYNYKLLSDVKNDGIEAMKLNLQDEKKWALEKLAKTDDKKWWNDYIHEIENKEKLLDKLDVDLLSEIGTDNGQLYKVAIPKDDVLLRENLPFSEQSEFVQEKVKELFNNEIENGEKYLKDIIKHNYNGKDIYEIIRERKAFEELGESLGGHYRNKYNNEFYKQAGLLANNYGIKGISYNGGIDGEARVIFNPDEIDIVRKYYNQPEAIEYFRKLQPNYGAVANSFDSVPTDKKYWKQYAKENLVGKSVDIPNYTTVTFTRNNLSKDYPYNLPEYPTLFDQLKGSNYAFSTNYKNEKDRIYDHFVNTNDNRLFDYLIEVIKDNEGNYRHNYKMMKNISRGDKP